MTEAVKNHPHVIETAQQILDYLPEEARTYTLPPGENGLPEAAEWPSFLLRYPQYAYANGDNARAARIFAEGRESMDGLRPEMQALAGSLIAVTFSQEQLEAMAL